MTKRGNKGVYRHTDSPKDKGMADSQGGEQRSDIKDANELNEDNKVRGINK